MTLGTCTCTGDTAPPGDAKPLQEYHIFYVHPPGSTCDADTVMRVEMDIQDLEREFEEHEGRLREAQVRAWCSRLDAPFTDASH